MSLNNKNVFITGGSSGIGQAMVAAFAKAGANVAFTYHSNTNGAADTLEQIAAYDVKKLSVQSDLAQLDTLDQLIDEVIFKFGHIDILVNNAGKIIRFDNFLNITLDALQQIMAVNLYAPFVLMKKIATHMQEQHIKGSILNISSVSAIMTSPGLAHYESSKAALEALTRGAASDLAPFNIRVNGIAPGLVATNMNKVQREQNIEAWINRSSKIPLGRAGKPDDIANLAVYLCSAQAEWITGNTFIVDGGLSVASPFK